jgi:HK97 family phage major capsid protein
VSRILGKPVYESSDMDSTYGSGENYVAVVGDFSNYVIFDRVGMSVELIPHLFATQNNRPSGQRGFFAHWRVGADSSNDAAFAVLNIT